MTTSSHNPAANPRFVLGAGIVIFGFVLMLDRLHIVDAEYVLRFWPLILIAIGLQQFFNPRPGRTHTQAIIWLAIGGWLLLESVGAVHASLWELFWPLLLIWFGWHLMQRHSPVAGAAAAMGSGTETADRLYAISILSGVKRTNTASPFRGGELTAFMGGGQIDLRTATIPPGEEASIDVFAVMGGYELLVPQGWVIVTPIVQVLGGIDDKRLAPPPGTSEVAGQAAPRLVLRGFILMGGIVVKS
jgi:hypothetical protein